MIQRIKHEIAASVLKTGVFQYFLAMTGGSKFRGEPSGFGHAYSHMINERTRTLIVTHSGV